MLIFWAALAWLATAIALRLPSRRAVLGIVFGCLVIVQVGALTHSVVLSSDLYRYVWDGRIQAAGIDPYRYRPVDAKLAPERDRWLFPSNSGCAQLHEPPGCTRINYRDAHTIYPPVAEAEFAVLRSLPGPPREHRQQLAADIAALAACLLLVRLLERAGRHPAWVTLFAWSPLVGLDLASDAHIDGLTVVLCLLAFLTWDPGLSRPPNPASSGRAAGTGLLIGSAVAVKLYPIMVLLAFVRRGTPRLHRRAAVLSAGLLLLAGYVPHVAAVGTSVLGFLPDYLKVEGYQQGSRFLLISGLGLPGSVTKAVAAAVLSAVLLTVLRSTSDRVPPARAALYLVGAAFLVATPVQPWYGLLPLALAVLADRPEWSVVAVAAYPLYFAGSAHQKSVVGFLSYGTAALVVGAVAALRTRSRRRAGADVCNVPPPERTPVSWTSWTLTRLR